MLITPNSQGQQGLMSKDKAVKVTIVNLAQDLLPVVFSWDNTAEENIAMAFLLAEAYVKQGNAVLADE